MHSLTHLDLPCYKISARSRKRSTRYALPTFSLFGLGANPWAKVHQRGDNPMDSLIYHIAKFHRPTSTHARDIRYQTSCGQTINEKQTVTDISPACLSASGDKKVKRSIAVRGNRLNATGNHMPYGITQCYMPPAAVTFPPYSSRRWYSI